jgi:hypothetical protein
MTIWATRSRSESVPSVLSTQRRCVELRGSLGERFAGGVEIAGRPDEVAGVIALHPAVAAMSAKTMGNERGVMLEYTIAHGCAFPTTTHSPRR